MLAVRAAAPVALMGPRRPVVDPVPLGAVVAESPHLRVQRVEYVGVEVADLSPTDERPNVLLDVLAVPADGALPALVLVEVAVEQLVDRGARARVPALVDRRQEPAPDGLGLLPRLRAGGHVSTRLWRLPVSGS